VIFEILCQEGNWELWLAMKDLSESLSKNVCYLRLALEVLDLVFHLSYIIKINNSNIPLRQIMTKEKLMTIILLFFSLLSITQWIQFIYPLLIYVC